MKMLGFNKTNFGTILGVSLILLTASMIISLFQPLLPDIITALFTLSCTFFVLGLSSTTNFSFEGIRNRSFYKWLKEELDSISASFIVKFAISFIVYFVTWWHIGSFKFWKIVISADVVCIVIMSYLIIYFIYNFFKLKQLKYDVYERVCKELESQDNPK